ncbi:MAG: hypothetical protein JXO51_00450 [Candidatus Aminicenantes bacterium]|nr:hypothetical protein [Candidatus Aminicenantes bacterium]
MSKKARFLLYGALSASILLLAIAWKVEALLLLFVLALVDPLLRMMRLGTAGDERSCWIEIQSGSFSFHVLYAVILALFLHKLLVLGRNPESDWYLLLFLPLILRAIFLLGKKGEVRRLGLILGAACGGFWLLFSLLSHGLQRGALWEHGIGISLLILTAVAWGLPLLGGPLLILAGAALFVQFCTRLPAGNPAMQVLMILLLPLPPFATGIAFLLSPRGKTKDEFADFREPDAGDPDPCPDPRRKI